MIHNIVNLLNVTKDELYNPFIYFTVIKDLYDKHFAKHGCI